MSTTHRIATLATARALKAAGFPQVTAFVWVCQGPNDAAGTLHLASIHAEKALAAGLYVYAAPMLEEAMAALPDEVDEDEDGDSAEGRLGVSVIPAGLYDGRPAGRRLQVAYFTEGWADWAHVNPNGGEAASQLFLALHGAGHIATAGGQA